MFDQESETLDSLHGAAAEVHAVMQPTPAYRWPLLKERIGCELWVKHENAAPTGAFKVRGGIVYFNRLRESEPRGVIGATRGNHGLSIAFNAARISVRATLVVPHGNSREKNAAMRSYGATIIEHGTDFQEALEYAQTLAREQDLHMVPSFAPDLVRGVASLALELFDAAGELGVAYAPIGLGSGLCGMLAARDALGYSTEIVGVVAEGAQTYPLSIKAGHPVESPVNTFSDGMACRLANAEALSAMMSSRIRFITVSDEDIAEAMRLYYSTTHCIAEPAGAASLAGALKDKRNSEARAAVVLSGANVDRDIYIKVLG